MKLIFLLPAIIIYVMLGFISLGMVRDENTEILIDVARAVFIILSVIGFFVSLKAGLS